VTLIGVDGLPRSSVISADGTYAVADVPAGPAKVAVFSHPRVPPGLLQEPGRRRPSGNDAANPHVPIPKRYEDPELSHLTCAVRRGGQTFDIDLGP
jgi:hypothetical protein